MTESYLFNNIKGIDAHSGSRNTAHVVHASVYVTEKDEPVPILYKENKHDNPEASVNEVSFSELARLFMLPHLTPKYHLVKDQNNSVTGVASEHIQRSIAQHSEISSNQYQKISWSQKNEQYQFEQVSVTKTDEIPYRFLDKLPRGFFAWLMNERAQGTLDVDMESVANLFAGKYTLEEDDLHKGNIGVYFIVKNNKKQAVFFSIDHDLMLSDSITSFTDSRVANWTYGETAFNITERDLRNFPDLKDSGNHYWPTRKRLRIHYDESKAYSKFEERAAFRQLKEDQEFNRYKWKRFLKHILIPEELMQNALSSHLDPDNPKDAAEIHLITQAMHERVIKLRAVLLSMPEFREYLNGEHSVEDINALQLELTKYMKEAFGNHHELHIRTQDEMNNRAALCLNYANPRMTIPTGDTPLHTLIRLGEFRFDQSQKAFGNYLNKANANGELPIDVAAKMAESYEAGSEKTDPGKDPLSIIKYLIGQGAEITPKVSQVLAKKDINIEEYRFQSHYYDREVNDYSDLKALITEIGQDYHLSLKTKKIITANLITQHIKQLSQEELKQLRADLNGNDKQPIAPEFLFISQLRSSLWIVRIIRGLYGNSSTRMELNELIDSTEKSFGNERTHQFFTQKSVITHSDTTPGQEPPKPA